MCHRCGMCCRGFTPQFYYDVLPNIPSIAKLLKVNEKQLMELYEESYKTKFTDNPRDCFCLDKDKTCKIYPFRPEVCQSFPLESMCGAADVQCSGYAEFRRIADAFMKNAKDDYFALDHIDRVKEFRSAPENEWPKLWKIFLSANPSQAMIESFVEVNQIPEKVRKLNPQGNAD